MATLNLLHPYGMKRLPADRHLFIYDNRLFERMNFGKNALAFMLGLCLDQNIDVLVGDTRAVLTRTIETHGITKIIIQRVYDEPLRELIRDLDLELEIIDDPLMFIGRRVEKASFFNYYQQIEPQLRKRAHDVKSHLDPE